MVHRVVELLTPSLLDPGSVVVDATIGLGGHAEALLRAAPHAVLVGLDHDTRALAHAEARLAGFGNRVHLADLPFDRLGEVLADLGIEAVAAVLFDLGLSSLQIDDPERGFSYAHDVPLDMRMDPRATRNAAEILNTYSVSELARVLRVYGEERFAVRIAEEIVHRRSRRPLTTTGELAELVRAAIPAPARRSGGHPAKRTFQALRIEVNDELGRLERTLPVALALLRLRGRIVVLSYHSLEDRIVKRFFQHHARRAELPDLPVPVGEPVLRLLTRGAERPDPEEVAANPRAASARLRAAERIRWDERRAA
ncbi:MAG: 16S rRNA (cytosine(1402)-N(4))-methyltransferase RsmH [Acidothermus sp.]|nr:16S rRNA (cytosine(1402)-N(4))-methyltransferase RsmH [Acidothermus sp.]MCL6537797.1 16S rRNA (cytosine(1402)-N(4))-methyltransferase RsmH [Acidothermus sp.]